jgi:hypothetical protein
MAERISVVDKGWKKLLDRLKDPVRTKVGVIGEAASTEHDGITNAELGAIHEFGAPGANIPARSFLRASLMSKLDEMKPIQQSIAKGIVEGHMTSERGSGILGAWGAGQVKRFIADGQVTPPDEPATVERKGSSKPLVDTGQLLGAISWERDK